MTEEERINLLQAADHIRSCNEADDALEEQEKKKKAYNDWLHDYIATEIRLAMQQESFGKLTGVSRAAVADIRAMMILNAMELGTRISHVTEIPTDHIERKVAELLPH